MLTVMTQSRLCLQLLEALAPFEGPEPLSQASWHAAASDDVPGTDARAAYVAAQKHRWLGQFQTLPRSCLLILAGRRLL
jgi:hypothetical protein